MEISNIHLGKNVKVDTTSTINNVSLGDNVKIAKFCSVYGSPNHLLEIGDHSYIGMFSIINGYSGKLTIGKHVSIAQNVNIMTDSGPNASPLMQSVYPIIKGDVTIDDHAWIGAGAIIMPNVKVGRCCIIAANSFLMTDAQAYSIYAGNPAILVKKITLENPNGNKKI
jgi:acetyltransferase-like isoleucine patch superfamily enzyme